MNNKFELQTILKCFIEVVLGAAQFIDQSGERAYLFGDFFLNVVSDMEIGNWCQFVIVFPNVFCLRFIRYSRHFYLFNYELYKSDELRFLSFAAHAVDLYELFFNSFHKFRYPFQHFLGNRLLNRGVFRGRARLAMLEKMVQAGELLQGEVGLAVLVDELLIGWKVL